MQIEKITLNQTEVDTIFNTIIETVNPQWAASYEKGTEVNFPLNDLIEVFADINLYVEYSEPDENGQTYATEVTVLKDTNVSIVAYAESVKGLEDTDIEDRLRSYNWIKYF